ncbi:MAG: hypothetical protein P4L33_08875 [Capsulimonadaceae bacterium]|nr:hypothetical protein [Capsulimonadaceae bacterium]
MIESLRRLAAGTIPYTRESLAAHFGLPSILFTQRGPSGPIFFHQAGAIIPLAYRLRGTVFWPRNRRIIPGVPQTLVSSDRTGEPEAARNDRAIIEALSYSEAVIETREPGIAVRLYEHGGRHYFATHTTHDAHDPLLGAGIENVRGLGLDIAGQARRLCDQISPRAYKLASLGYVLVFVLLLPERDTFPPADRPDLILVDVIDPDYEFVDRLEKERICADYGLHLVAQHGRIGAVATPGEYFSRLRALELASARDDDAPGFIVKAAAADGQSLRVCAEPPEARTWAQQFDIGDLKAAHETIREDFAGTILPPELLEELMLDYLCSRRRTVRWQVAGFIASL